jgi:hypothetical protein
MPRDEFDRALKWGLDGEREIGIALRKRGGHIISTHGARDRYVLGVDGEWQPAQPDFQIAANDGLRFIEVKRKQRATFYRDACTTDTGVNLSTFRGYVQHKRLTQRPTWIVFIHEHEDVVIGNELDALVACIRESPASNGMPDMAYWSFDQLLELAKLTELRSEPPTFIPPESDPIRQALILGETKALRSPYEVMNRAKEKPGIVPFLVSRGNFTRTIEVDEKKRVTLFGRPRNPTATFDHSEEVLACQVIDGEWCRIDGQDCQRIADKDIEHAWARQMSRRGRVLKKVDTTATLAAEIGERMSPSDRARTRAWVDGVAERRKYQNQTWCPTHGGRESACCDLARPTEVRP